MTITQTTDKLPKASFCLLVAGGGKEARRPNPLQQSKVAEESKISLMLLYSQRCFSPPGLRAAQVDVRGSCLLESSWVRGKKGDLDEDRSVMDIFPHRKEPLFPLISVGGIFQLCTALP